MKSLFTRKTFQYFDLAKKNNKKKEWFKKHKEEFEKEVRAPLATLLAEMEHRFSSKLPEVVMGPRKISRPLRSARKAESQGWVRASGMFYLSEKTTSFFEWNPGIYFQVGDEKQDNVIGVGLYMPSSRQIKRLRSALARDHKAVDKILADRKLKKYWGGLAEEKYKRFPKDYFVHDPAAKYLWYKQFFLSRHFTRKDVTSKEFASEVLKSYEAALPFLAWVRDAVGVYDRAEALREKREKEQEHDLADDERAAMLM